MIVLFNKDFFNGQSVVKRHLGYQVIDVKASMPADHFKCMLRNITAPIWPIEVLCTLINKQRRLGDFLAGTRVVEVTPSNPEEILLEMENRLFDKNATLALMVSVVVVILYTVLVDPKLGLF